MCHPNNRIWTEGGVEEAARARVRCAWANSHSHRRCTGGASYHIKGKIYRAWVQSVFTYGTGIWADKRTERMMARWMCGVSDG